jgi:hypothetical protein
MKRKTSSFIALLLYTFLFVMIWGCADKGEKDIKNKASSLGQYSNVLSRVGVPDKNPFKLLSKMIGIELISIQYYSPYYDSAFELNRKLWGGVLKNDSIWRVGLIPSDNKVSSDDRPIATVDIPTAFSLHDSDEYFAGVKTMGKLTVKETFPAGTYSISLIPKESSAILILEPVSAGSAQSNERRRKIEYELNLLPVDLYQENLWIQINNVQPYSRINSNNKNIDYTKCEINLVWGNRSTSFIINFGDIEYVKIVQNVDSILNTPTNQEWELYYEAADYFVRSVVPDSILNIYGPKWISKAYELFNKSNVNDDKFKIDKMIKIINAKAEIFALLKMYDSAKLVISQGLQIVKSEDQNNLDVMLNTENLLQTEKSIIEREGYDRFNNRFNNN